MSSHPDHDIHASCETDHAQEETGQISMQESTETDEPKRPVGRPSEDSPDALLNGTLRFEFPSSSDDTDEGTERPIPERHRDIDRIPKGQDGQPIKYEMFRISDEEELSPLTREDSKEQEPISRPGLSPTPLVADSARCRHWTLMLLFFLFGTIASGIYYRWRHQVAMEALKAHLTLGAREEAGV